MKVNMLGLTYLQQPRRQQLGSAACRKGSNSRNSGSSNWQGTGMPQGSREAQVDTDTELRLCKQSATAVATLLVLAGISG